MNVLVLFQHLFADIFSDAEGSILQAKLHKVHNTCKQQLHISKCMNKSMINQFLWALCAHLYRQTSETAYKRQQQHANIIKKAIGCAIMRKFLDENGFKTPI